MKNLIILLLLLLSVVSHAQIREMLQHFPVPGVGAPEHSLQQPRLSVPEKPTFFKPDIRKTNSSQTLLDTVYCVIHTSSFLDVLEADSAYFISGYGHHATNFVLDPDNPAMLIRLKVSYAGELLWYRIDSLMRGDHFVSNNTSIIHTTDDNYVQVGVVINDYNNWKNSYIRMPVYTKFNTNGDTLWQRLFVDTADRNTGDWPMDIIPEPDGGFSVAALTGSHSKTYAASNDFWYNDSCYLTLISYDSLCNITRRKSFFIGGDQVQVMILFLKRQADNGYLIGGVNRFNGPAPNMANYYLMKVDSLWNFQWQKTLGKSYLDATARMNITDFKNGQAFFAAQKQDTPTTIWHGETYYTSYTQYGKFDTDYNIISDTNIQLKLGEYTVPPSPTFIYTTWGHVQGFEMTEGDMVVCENLNIGAFLGKLDSNYQFKWHRWISYYPDFEETTYKMRKASDGGYLIVGRSNYTGKGGWLVKTDTLGCALPNCADTLYHMGIETQERGKQQLRYFPNPTTEILSLQTKDNTPLPQGKLQILNMQGALQMEINIPKHQSQLELNLRHLPAGLYLGRILSSSGEGGGFRFVKE